MYILLVHFCVVNAKKVFKGARNVVIAIFVTGEVSIVPAVSGSTFFNKLF